MTELRAAFCGELQKKNAEVNFSLPPRMEEEREANNIA